MNRRGEERRTIKTEKREIRLPTGTRWESRGDMSVTLLPYVLVALKTQEISKVRKTVNQKM
jgi:hypothetical protein